MQLSQLLHHYSTEATLFMYVHVFLLAWAVVSVVSARIRVEKHLQLLRKRVRPRKEGHANPWDQLLVMYAKDPHPAFTEVEVVYNGLFEDAAGVLNRLTNLLLLTGVAGTLYGLYGGAGAGATSATWEALRSGAFNAFSVTIVAVALAGTVTLFGRWLDGFLARRKAEVALLWNDQAGGGSGDLAVWLGKLPSEFAPALQGLREELAIARQEGHHLKNVVIQCEAIGTALGSISEAVGNLLQGLSNAQTEYAHGLRENLDAAGHTLTDHLDETRKTVQADHDDYRKTLKDLNEALERTLADHRAEIVNLQSKTVSAFGEVESRTSELFGRLGNDVYNLGQRLQTVVPQLTSALTDFRPLFEASQKAVLEVADATRNALDSVRSSAEAMRENPLVGWPPGGAPPPSAPPQRTLPSVAVMFVISLIAATAAAFLMRR